jgi:FO synthase
MAFPAPDPDLAAALIRGHGDVGGLFAEARRLRDDGKGRTVTYSRKVFIPLTTLCRDRCTYCTFAKPPGAGGTYLEPGDVLAVARAGEAAGCTEALLTLGDAPEHRWPAARRFLERRGLETTIDYVVEMSEAVAAETSLFPHANPGVMSEDDIARLRPTNVSMGLMLENVSPRLMEPGMPHHRCPDKDPAVRMETIRAAGRRRVPFTSGILIGIGETPGEIADSLFALADLHSESGGIQEVIVQNFRAKADTPKRRDAEPTVQFTARVAAVARWVLGAAANIQVPPNLTERYEAYLDAGINDWGGVSPVTIDWVNPEAPWPHLDELRERTEAAGFRLAPRLPAYPEYLTAEWIHPALLGRVRAAVDGDGHALAPAAAA